MPTPDRRPGLRAKIALGWLFCSLPPFAVGGGLALAPSAAIAGLIGFPARMSGRAWTTLAAVSAPLLALAAWAAFSTTWSPAGAAFAQTTFDFGEGPFWMPIKLAAAYTLGLALVAGAASASDSARRFGRAVVVACCLALVGLLLIEAIADMPLNRLAQPDTETGALMRNPGRGGAILVAIVWGAVAALIGAGGWRSLLWRALLVLAAVLGAQFAMAATWVALAIGTVGFCLAWAAPRVAPWLAAGGVAAWTLAAPTVSAAIAHMPGLAERLPASWAMRLGIWDYTTSRIAEAPVIGHGLDSSRLVTDLVEIGPYRVFGIPLHPHSMSLHVWYELGAVGAALLAAAILAIGFAISRLGRREAVAAGTAALLTVAAIWNVSYGAWQEWWIGTAFAAAAAVALSHGAAPAEAEAKKNQRIVFSG